MFLLAQRQEVTPIVICIRTVGVFAGDGTPPGLAEIAVGLEIPWAMCGRGLSSLGEGL